MPREEIALVAHVEHDRVMLAWGAFYYQDLGLVAGGDHRFKIVDDGKLKKFPEARRTRGTFGRNTESYGPARTRIGEVLADGSVDWHPWLDAHWATFNWHTDVRPNTRYRYEVEVNGSRWAAPLRTVITAQGERGVYRRFMTENGKTGTFDEDATLHASEFTTFPHPDAPSGTLRFAVLGDPGTGKAEQYAVGARLAELIDKLQIRFVLTTGDNIYARGSKAGKVIQTITGRFQMSGDEDDDWIASYYLPYRDVINRVPVFPCLGNHDSENTEDDDDLPQMIDNFYLLERFAVIADRWRIGDARYDTLFYRFPFGRDTEFVAVDTSFSDRSGARPIPLEMPPHQEFIQEVLDSPAPAWRIPFGHHPPFTLGPNHKDNERMQRVAERFAAEGGVRVWLSGHEHNCQHHQENGVHYVVTGASGKGDSAPKRKTGRACCYAVPVHVMVVTVGPGGVQIELHGINGRVAPVRIKGSAFPEHKHDVIEIPA
ncbi:MAG TPA: metallophosphoesterase [Longimicrobium sp.]|jgi:hypothetical protein